MTTEYLPRFLYGSSDQDRDALNELRNHDIEWHDTFLQQLESLLRSRHAKRALTQQEVAKGVASYAAGSSLDNLGVWVYYPWRRSVVHLLNEADFIELRTSRNRYKITAEEQALLSQRKVGVIGLSVGGQVALTLATERSCGELRLADFDVLEISNLNRLREGVFNLGLKKTTLAARAIAEIDPFLKVICYDEGITDQNMNGFLEGLDVLVEECDGLAVKLKVRDRAKELGIPVVMEANDRATLDIERFDLEPNRPILHGLLEGLDLTRVGELKTNDEKVPYLMPMVGEATMSDKLRASLLEVGESIETWPQLASDVALGAGLVANVVRRIALGQLNNSGRFFVDLEELVKDRAPITLDVSQNEILDVNVAAEPILIAKDQIDLNDIIIEELLQAAILAPSGGNEQPWQWVRFNSELQLFPKRFFGDSLLNYRNNATFLALGAAAENIVLEAHDLGLHVKVNPPTADQQFCRFRFYSSPVEGVESHTWDELASFIDKRETNRRITQATPIDDAILNQLALSIGDLCELKFATDRKAIANIAEVAGCSDRIRMLHPQGHRDLVREIRWTKEDAEYQKDGIDLSSMELTAAEHAGLRMIKSDRAAELLRHWKRGKSLERLTRKAIINASAVGLITVPKATIENRFIVGRALERLWLTATKLGLSLQPHTAAVFLFARAFGADTNSFNSEELEELSSLRNSLREVFQITSGDELFLFRLFPGSQALGSSLRRPISLLNQR